MGMKPTPEENGNEKALKTYSKALKGLHSVHHTLTSLDVADNNTLNIVSLACVGITRKLEELAEGYATELQSGGMNLGQAIMLVANVIR